MIKSSYKDSDGEGFGKIGASQRAAVGGRRQVLRKILWLPSRSPEQFFVRATRVCCVIGTGLFLSP